MQKREKHFVLVHGACHGAWCWYKVSTLLKSAGHKVTMLDMAASGKHPKQVHELRSLLDYLEPLVEFMASLPPEERVILVGHSIGGLSISDAMERFPEKVSVAVFCAAFMPNPDLSLTTLVEEYNRRMDSYMDSTYTFEDGPNNEPTSVLFGPNFMASKLYQLSPPEDLTLAVLLARPHPMFKDVALPNEVVAVSKERYGSIDRVYIVCDQDNIMKEDLQRWIIEKYPTDEEMVISGSDHMPMVSKPKELFTCLQEIADKFT
ncbi:polyneuridine-aldehyde esterase-like [Pistacia vera]|uniref:polyneuridine-aldehyde esterase-like n=1 Tax=Pistacia vera TaxID=55513 RepID=UPI0012630FB3|nr:polyneuridine-aldehyde esterase-like [Pistacia vera]